MSVFFADAAALPMRSKGSTGNSKALPTSSLPIRVSALRRDIDRAAVRLDRICVSAGKRGLQLWLAAADLIKLTGARPIDVASDL